MIRFVEGELYIRRLKVNKRDMQKINQVCSFLSLSSSPYYLGGGYPRSNSIFFFISILIYIHF